jgi:hypothetical protein
LGWLDVREVRLRDGQMGTPDYPNTLVGTFPITRQTRSYIEFAAFGCASGGMEPPCSCGV